MKRSEVKQLSRTVSKLKRERDVLKARGVQKDEAIKTLSVHLAVREHIELTLGELFKLYQSRYPPPMKTSRRFKK